MTVSGSGFGVRDGCAASGPSGSFSVSARRVAASAAVSAHAVCAAMSATMTHESSHAPQASTFGPYRPPSACRAVLLPLPARQRPMKSPPMSMFPKASLTGRVVRANNTMRMAKSWGHRGGPVPVPECCFGVATSPAQAPLKGGEKAVPESFPRMPMQLRSALIDRNTVHKLSFVATSCLETWHLALPIIRPA